MIAIPMPAPIILYDPTEVQMGGRTGRQEALHLANNRGIPVANVLEIPLFGSRNYLNVLHNGNVIIITHGNLATGFATASQRTRGPNRNRVTAAQMCRTLASTGLLRDRTLAYRFELLICQSASGNNTFARQFYDEMRARVADIRVKASPGSISISRGGELSVTYFTIQQTSSLFTAPVRLAAFSLMSPLRFISNRLPELPENPISSYNIMLHDWVFYPSGTEF